MRSWKTSWWIGLPLVPLGLLAWAAFLYIGVRAARTRWVLYGIAYLVVDAAGFGLTTSHRTGGIGGAVIVFAWLIPLGHALAIRTDANRRIDARSLPELQAAEKRELARERGRSIAAHDPRKARALGIGRPDRRGFDAGSSTSTTPRGSSSRASPASTDALAKKIVAVREEVGGFSSLNDAGEILSLDAETVDRLRPEVVVLPRD